MMTQLKVTPDAYDKSAVNRIGKDDSKYSIRNHNRQQFDHQQRQFDQQRQQGQEHQPKKGFICRWCGNTKCQRQRCPARGFKCGKCGITGHFEKCCLRSQYQNNESHTRQQQATLNYIDINQTEQQQQQPPRYVPITWQQQNATSTSSDYLADTYQHLNQGKVIYAFSPTNEEFSSTKKVELQTLGKPIIAMVDTGAEENIILQKHIPKGTILSPTSISLLPFGSKPILPLGELLLPTTWGNKTIHLRWLVLDNDSLPGKAENILSGAAAQKLDILKFCEAPPPKVYTINADHHTDHHVKEILNKYPDTHKGLGKLHDKQVHLYTKQDVKPIIQPPRPIPYHLREKFAESIQQLLADDVIEEHVGPVTWVSNPVLVPKPDGTLRVCVDLRQVNKSLENTHLPIPRIEDILPMFANKKVFSKLDLKTAFHQLELDIPSRDLTVFRVKERLMRFKRLTMGTLSASGELNYRLKPLLTNIPFVDVIQDDIIIATNTHEEHYKALETVMEKLATAGLTLNLRKCIFAADEIPFWGMRVTADGLKPDHEKVRALQAAGPPCDKDEVNSFLCMIRANADFIPNLAVMTTNMRQLTNKNTKFQWTAIHDTEFNNVKKAFNDSILLRHYDAAKNTFVIVDAHVSGLSAILAQGDTIKSAKPVALASRSTTSTEQRYDQLSLEALAIDFGLRRFNHYLVGANKITVITDHKPLESIWKRVRPWQVPFRIERIQLRHQHINYEVLWYPGQHNVADYMSRHAIMLKELPAHIQEEATEHAKLIFMLHKTKYVDAISPERIIAAQKMDLTLRNLYSYIRLGKQPLNAPELKSYKNIFNELSISDGGILLRGHVIILPPSLYNEAITLAHQGGHPGQDGVIRRLRAHFWFPAMNDIITDQLETCHLCQQFTNSPIKAPLSTTAIPERPWEDVSLDLFGPLPDQTHFLVARCNLSRFPDAKKVKSTSGDHVLPALAEIYNNYGNPTRHKADNGPPFNGKQFHNFSEQRGITVKHTPPYHPQSNEAECFMKPLGKAVKVALEERKDTTAAVNDLLQAYRSTPHKSTGVAPGNVMLNGGYRSQFPQVKTEINIQEIREKDMALKLKHNFKTNSSKYRQYSAIIQGDLVLVKRAMKQRKWDSLFESEPYVVQQIQGTCMKLYRYSDEKSVRRHINETKLYHGKNEVSYARPKFRLSTAPTPLVQPAQMPIEPQPAAEQHSAIDIQTAEDEHHNEATNPPSVINKPHSDRLLIPPIQLKAVGGEWQKVDGNCPKRTRKMPSRLKDHVVKIPYLGRSLREEGGGVVSELRTDSVPAE